MPPTRSFLISSLARVGTSFSRLRTWVIVLPIVFGIFFWQFGSSLRRTAEHYRRESLVSWQIAELEAMGFEVEVTSQLLVYAHIQQNIWGNKRTIESTENKRFIKSIRLKSQTYPRSPELTKVLKSIDWTFRLDVADSNFDSRDLQNLSGMNVRRLNAAGTAVDDCSAEGWSFPYLWRLDLRDTKAGAKLVNSLSNSPRLDRVYIDPIPPDQLLPPSRYPFEISHKTREQTPLKFGPYGPP